MAMNVGSSSGDDEVMVEMNTTPLIDVMLVMLVMLIITIPIQTHAVKLDMPPPNQPPPPTPPTVVNLGIDFDGTITWNNTPVNMDQLDAYFAQEAERGPDQDEIHVNPNRLAKYNTVALVLADAQRRGVTKIGIGNTSDYLQ
ncbi:MAG TPA: biopolymer transporter ExbD [Rhizomicrobium sp.]|nr:biopolymer transporter ExbD [Rhizomicrobium sp.]